MHVMVDLETMGNTSTSAIVSIGAVEFDPYDPLPQDKDQTAPYVFYRNVSLHSSLQAGLDVSADTMMWWLRQSGEAREELTIPEPIKLYDALVDFSDWFLVNSGQYIWAHAGFDLPILANAYRKCDIVQPWSYFFERDLRTLEALAHIKTTGNDHRAWADAWNQVLTVQKGYGILGV